MGDLLKMGKSLMLASVVKTWITTVVFLLLAFGLVFGDGGTFSIAWIPLGGVENVSE